MKLKEHRAVFFLNDIPYRCKLKPLTGSDPNGFRVEVESPDIFASQYNNEGQEWKSENRKEGDNGGRKFIPLDIEKQIIRYLNKLYPLIS